MAEAEDVTTGEQGLLELGGPQHKALSEIARRGGAAGVVIELSLSKGRREPLRVREVRRGVRVVGRQLTVLEISARIEEGLKGLSRRAE